MASHRVLRNQDTPARILLDDNRFHALLPDEEWGRLPLAVWRRFSKRLAGGGTIVYVGEVDDSFHSRIGWWLAQVARLIGGPPKATLDGGKTIPNYWPYATTVFDFIRRSMPFTQPRSLTDQEVYALTAYVLAGNKLIGEGDEMNATTLPKVAMPNRGNFVIRFPDRI